MDPQERARDNIEAALEGVNPAEASRIAEIWNLLDRDPDDAIPTPELRQQARSDLLAKIGGDRKAVDRPVRRSSSSRHRTLLWPAAVVLLIGAIALAWWIDPVSVRVPPGEQRTITLPDGSTVELNSGSAVQYARGFGVLGSDRVVRLEGEAYFDVVSGSRAFVVKTFNARVTVLGTRFNVRSWRDVEESTTVTVDEGRVRVSPTAEALAGATLESGKSVQIASASADSVALTPSDATAWRRGDLVFKGRMVAVIISDVERRFDIDVELDPSIAETTRMHLVLRAPLEAEGVIRDLAGALDYRYRRRADGFELYDPR